MLARLVAGGHPARVSWMLACFPVIASAIAHPALADPADTVFVEAKRAGEGDMPETRPAPRWIDR
jgi:hypothetical protein